MHPSARASLIAALFATAAVLYQVSMAQTATPSAPEPTEEVIVSSLPNRGAAPEIESLAWLNSEVPLRLADLRGRVVLMEFWTFDCINCIHTLPTIEGWYQTYHDQGLEVIGIHYPELSYERDLQNILAATQRLGVTYPVGLDNEGVTWGIYGQRYWPTIYLIDKMGNIRYVRFGEGGYDETEQALTGLLAETYTAPDGAAENSVSESVLPYLTPDDVMNVRSAPGINEAIIGAINPGMAFVILDQTDNWYQIRYNDGVGYVSGDLVTVTRG